MSPSRAHVRDAAYSAAARADAALVSASISRNDRFKRAKRQASALYGGSRTTTDGGHDDQVNDRDLLCKEHEFLRDEDQEHVAKDNMEYSTRLARKHYESLYKEFAIANLSRYKEGRIGLRWCTEAEVVSGKGRDQCGEEHCQRDSSSSTLSTYEVPFSYTEHKELKVALVKVTLCAKHAKRMLKLNRRKRDEAERKRRGKVKEAHKD